MGFTKVDEHSDIRPDGRNCLLAYGYDGTQQAALLALLQQAGIDMLVEVTPGGTGCLLRDLIANTPQEHPMEPLPPVPVVVFHAVSDGELNRFLTLFRGAGLPRPLFAVATETSIHWRFGDLASELMRERRAMEKKG